MENAERRPDRIVIGVVTIVATVFAMSVADAMVKYVSAGFPLWQIYVLRSLLAIAILVIFQVCGREPVRLRPKAPFWAYLRSLLLALMYIAIYAAAPVLSLSVIAAALYTGPLFIALFSALLIGEPLGPRRWAGVLLGFIGVLTILRPGSESFSYAMLIPVIAALLYALAAIITRTKCVAEAPVVLALSLNIALLAVGAAASAAIMLWRPSAVQAAIYPFLLGYWVPMGLREWGIILALALLITAIGAGLAKAYQSAPPAIIATFDYSYLLFAALWSFLVFGQVPDAATVIGMLLIAAAGLLVLRRPRSLTRRNPPADSSTGPAAPRR
jgi:drug/metabolite transporter (DMT)-like permease